MKVELIHSYGNTAWAVTVGYTHSYDNEFHITETVSADRKIKTGIYQVKQNFKL